MTLAQVFLFYSLIGLLIWWGGIVFAFGVERRSEASVSWAIDTPLTISGYTWTGIDLEVSLTGRYMLVRGALTTAAGQRILGSGTCVAEDTVTCSILMGSLHLMMRLGPDLNGVLDVYQVSTQAHGGTFGLSVFNK